MITTNAIQRTFHIKVGGSTGTCFTIDVESKQYLVTAKHVISDLDGDVQIEIYHGGEWKVVNVSIVGHSEGEIDVSVMAARTQLSPSYSLEPTAAGLIYGQEVFFLGFPYQMAGDMGPLNRDFPLPFVKSAIVSCMYSENEAQLYFLDGHNNPGFSGGPVIFKNNGTGEFKVCSVVSGYRASEEPIYQNGVPVPLASRVNTGIVITYGIKHALDLIERNPIGAAIQA